MSEVEKRLAAIEKALERPQVNVDYVRNLEMRVAVLESGQNQLINEIRALNGLERIDFERMEREAKEQVDQQIRDLLDHFDQERK